MIDKGKRDGQGHTPISISPIHPHYGPSKGARHRHLPLAQAEVRCGLESGMQAMIVV